MHMWGQPPSAVQSSESSTGVFMSRASGSSLFHQGVRWLDACPILAVLCARACPELAEGVGFNDQQRQEQKSLAALHDACLDGNLLVVVQFVSYMIPSS